MNADRILFSFFWHKRNPIWNRQWCRVDTKWTMASEFPLFIHNGLYYRRKKYNKSNYWCRRVIKKRILCIVVSWYIRSVCSPRSETKQWIHNRNENGFMDLKEKVLIKFMHFVPWHCFTKDILLLLVELCSKRNTDAENETNCVNKPDLIFFSPVEMNKLI